MTKCALKFLNLHLTGVSSLICLKAKNKEKLTIFFVDKVKPILGSKKCIYFLKLYFWRLFFEVKGRFLASVLRNVECQQQGVDHTD